MRYYSTQRPVGPGTYPARGAGEVVNFDHRIPVTAIGRTAWGYIVYDRELTEKECERYELVKDETEPVEVAHITIDADNEFFIIRNRRQERNPYRIFEAVPHRDGKRKRLVEEYATMREALRHIMAVCPDE